jgi:hypothetical protein
MRLLVKRLLRHNPSERLGGELVISTHFVEPSEPEQRREVRFPQAASWDPRLLLVATRGQPVPGVELDGRTVGRRVA